MFTHDADRRSLLIALAAVSATPFCSAAAQTLPRMVVHRDPSCGCCGAWIEHIRHAGFIVDEIETSELSRIRATLGVPRELAACHTAEIGGYVVEGHVPADSIKRLIVEKPNGGGLAVRGMPIGSPGMERAGIEPETYDVILFGPAGQRAFATYRGGQAL